MNQRMNQSRLTWACRRGMKELDVLLQPFVKNKYESLSKQDQETFEELLSFEDPVLFAWFMKEEKCDNPKLNAMLYTIREQRYT